MNQSRVVDDKFWADDIGDDDELTADVDGCCKIVVLRIFEFKLLVDVVDEDGIDDVIK